MFRVVRKPSPTPGEIAWDPAAGQLDPQQLVGLDGVVHLSGEPIAGGRWTAARKRAILDSRVGSTRLLCERLAGLAVPPRVLVCASAIGYYGARGDELLDEQSAPGSGFLAEVCTAWEAACAPARDAGIRVVHARIGVVLAREGGALASMLPPFRLGLGGPLGDGRAFMSWITLEDLVGAIGHALTQDQVVGPMNAVAPNPVRNAEFTRALGQALHRPAVLPVPSLALRLALGEMGPALLLASTRVVPRVLLDTGYVFQHPTLAEALQATLAA